MGEQRETRQGTRCAVCVQCGRCFEVSEEEVDAISGATDWASAFKALDDGSAGKAPAVVGPPGAIPAPSTESMESIDACDAVTGATPGVASACKELGLDDRACLAERLGIKPPGVS